jgi:hypothetical protein
MEILNDTPFEVEAIPCMGPEGKTVLTIIVKGTFDMVSGQPGKAASEQIPVAFGDEYYNESDGGSVKFESDVAPFKPRTDIVLVGRACAPKGALVRALDVSLRVGQLRKTIRVYGDRKWQSLSRFLPDSISEPQPFSTMDIVYERAFGGIDKEGGGFCEQNLIGCGFFEKKSAEALDGSPLPNLEDPNNRIRSWKDHPKPVGFGFYGRAWMPRRGFLGTYDEKWRKERSPDPPKDFRFEYYNGAHPDLRINGFLKGDEEVELVNLTPDRKVGFQLPGLSIKCNVSKSVEPLESASSSVPVEQGEDIEYVEDEDMVEEFEEDDMYDEFDEDDMYEDFEEDEEPPLVDEKVNLNIDTLCLIPDEKRFYMVWRGLCPIQDLGALEVKTIEIR